jgi:hypothetical protein
MLVAILLAVTPATALINPNFTPVNLVKESELILALRIKEIDAKDRATAEVVKCLKGKDPGKTITIDFSKPGKKEDVAYLKRILAGVKEPLAMIFVGTGEGGAPLSKLCIESKWIVIDPPDAEGLWSVDVIDGRFQDVWAGGTDMLLKLCEILIADPSVDVPVKSTFTWGEKVEIGKVGGKVGQIQALDIAGKGELVLFVASDAGDRIFAWDAGKRGFADLTSKLKLGSHSVQAAWGDFNGDRLLDLASWDGKKAALWLQAADGSFSSVDIVAEGLKTDCLGLTAMDAGAAGRAGLLWSSSAAPTLLVPDARKAGTFTLRALVAANGAVREAGAAGKCLVADFDGDALPDVIQPFANGSIFFKGQAGGTFAEGVACPLALGPGRTTAFLGDWDLDGRCDVYAAAEDTSRLWQNEGGGKFSDQFGFPLQQNLAGEITYISKPFGACGATCDFNCDGMQDILLAYSQMTAPQLFFNRGFRSFGHGHSVDLEENGLLPGISSGQQGAVVADFDGDGAQDFVIIALDGSAVMFPHSAGDPSHVVRVALAPGGAFAGPLLVTATDGRKKSAWVVTPGNEAYLGRTEAGVVEFSWRLPGGELQKKSITVENKPVRFVIPDGK